MALFYWTGNKGNWIKVKPDLVYSQFRDGVGFPSLWAVCLFLLLPSSAGVWGSRGRKAVLTLVQTDLEKAEGGKKGRANEQVFVCPFHLK